MHILKIRDLLPITSKILKDDTVKIQTEELPVRLFQRGQYENRTVF